MKPSLKERILVFLALSGQYFEAASLFATEDAFRFPDPQPEKTREAHLYRQIRLMLLRKFVFDPTGQMNIGLLLSDCIDDFRLRGLDELEEAETGYKLFEQWRQQSPFVVQVGDAEEFGALEAIENLIYGSLLHGDVKRWTELQKHGDNVTPLLGMWLPRMEKHLRITSETLKRWVEKQLFE